MNDSTADASESRVPDLLVEKLALDELGAAKARSVRERLGDDAQARLAAIDASNAEIMEALPPALMAAQISAQVRSTGAPEQQAQASWTPWLAVGGLAAAGMALWMFIDPTGGTLPDSPGADGGIAQTQPQADSGPVKVARLDPATVTPPDDRIRFKGGTKLTVSRNSDTGPAALAAGSKVAAGDNLQVSYAAGDAQYGVIVSIDGDGAATLHFPESLTGNPSLRGRANLANGYELDDATGFERFFFVSSESKLSVASVMAAAEKLATGPDARSGELVLADGLAQQSVLLVK